MDGFLNRWIASIIERIARAAIASVIIIALAVCQCQSGEWVLTDIRDDLQQGQNTEAYPYHNVAASTGNPPLTTVNTKETWTDNRCNGHAESTSSWTQLPERIASGSTLKIKTTSAISGGQTCAEHDVGASTMMYVYGAQRLSNTISYWTSEPTPSPSVKVSNYEVPEGRPGDQMEVLMIGAGPGGRFLRYYTYNWQEAATDCGWNGTWNTEWGPLELQQSGDTVTGTYTHDQGRIQGTISGNILVGTWSESPSYSPPNDAGDFEFTMSDDCKSFGGSWRYGSTGSWAGSWSGTR
jgi:hypothetical protein